MRCFQNVLAQSFSFSRPNLVVCGALAWESGALGSGTSSASDALLGGGTSLPAGRGVGERPPRARQLSDSHFLRAYPWAGSGSKGVLLNLPGLSLPICTKGPAPPVSRGW